MKAESTYHLRVRPVACKLEAVILKLELSQQLVLKSLENPLHQQGASVQCFKNLLQLQLFQYYPHTDTQVHDSTYA